MENIPTEQELNDHYDQYSYASDRQVSLATVNSYNVLLDEFEQFRQSNCILDVGCGRGWFLDEAKARGWNVFGTEFSQTAVQICRRKGITTFQGVLNPRLFERADFDVITSFEVLEHINDPNDEVARIVSLMRVGGLFYCTTPNFNSLQRLMQGSHYNIINYPEHLGYFTKKTLNFLMYRHGLEMIKFKSTGLSLVRLMPRKNKRVGAAAAALAPTSVDERLRLASTNKSYLKIAKGAVNSALNATNSGLTLKGYYVK
jgi:2-polyprenyl-3-methyl-5-hydroxy-6-metoxy-1,4-benzoquinol methylase